MRRDYLLVFGVILFVIALSSMLIALIALSEGDSIFWLSVPVIVIFCLVLAALIYTALEMGGYLK